MSLKATSKSASFKPIPVDKWVPVVVSKVEDLGLMEIPVANRRPDGPTHQPKMRVEFADADGGTAILTYTISTNSKASVVKNFADAGIQIPESYDFADLVGTQLKVKAFPKLGKSGKPYSAISKFDAADAGQAVVAPRNAKAEAPATQAPAPAVGW